MGGIRRLKRDLKGVASEEFIDMTLLNVSTQMKESDSDSCFVDGIYLFFMAQPSPCFLGISLFLYHPMGDDRRQQLSLRKI